MSTHCKDYGTAGYDTTFGWGMPSAAACVGGLGTPPGAFNLTSPAGGATAVSQHPTFTWSVSSTADNYTLTIDVDPNFSSPEQLQFTGLTSTSFALTSNTLDKDQTYYWKVYSYNLAGSSASTPVSRSFTTLHDCNNNGVHDATEIAGNPALDCNGNGVLDSCELAGELITGQSAYLRPLDVDHPQQLTMVSPKRAGGTVSITLIAAAQLAYYTQYVTVDVNGVVAGILFQPDGMDCSQVTGTVTMSAAAFNTAVNGGNAVIHVVPSAAVTAGCPENYLKIIVQYAAVAGADCNGNGVLDSCDIANHTSTDTNHNGIPDECDLCRGDANCDRVVNWRDIDYFVAGLNDNQSAWATWFPRRRADVPVCEPRFERRFARELA